MTVAFRTRWLSLLLIAGAFLLLAVPLLMGQGLLVKIYVHDMFFNFDSAWRSALRQVPHLDFHSPVGQAYYWPFQLLGLFAWPDALTVVKAHVVVGAVLAVAMAVALPRRLSPWDVAFAAIVILAMAMSPREFDGRSSFDYSFLAPYNRWGWALFMLVAQIALVPPRRETRWDGLILGLLGALLYYLKMTFFLAAGAMLLVGWALRYMCLRTLLIAGATFAGIAVLVELICHNNIAYLSDLMMATIAAREVPVVSNVWQLPTIIQMSAIALAAAIVASWPAPGSGGTRIAERLRVLAAVLAVLLAGMALSVQNHPVLEYGQCVIAVLIAWQHGRRFSSGQGVPAPRWAGPLYWLVIVVAIGWTMILPLKDVRATMTYPIEVRKPVNCRIPELVGTPAADLMIPASVFVGGNRDAADIPCSAAHLDQLDPQLGFSPEAPVRQLWKLRAIMRLLRDHARPGDHIFAADFTNPYPFIRRAEPTPGAMIWWSAGRTYAPSRHPDPAAMLRSTDLVIEMKGDLTFEAGEVWKIYRPYVERHFSVVSDGPKLRLWRRR